MSTEKEGIASIGVIILAAGASSRLGRPKQLLLYRDKTLLQHAWQTAVTAKLQPVVVVLGAEAEKIKREITGKDVHVAVNTEWSEGMASSIRCGIKAFMEMSPEAAGVILMVCDQPLVTASLLKELVTAHQKTAKPVVSCSYAGTFGPPTFFHSSFFQELLQLKGDVGARGVVSQHADSVEVISFPEGNLDVDTERDYEKIKSAGKE